ncbi:Deoxyhypusine synthase [Gigaspora margarita]|uniref:deoxyhypusine synthase n=1 Tax=Gigaspora margarita TaxID=4874 RepID=A0A8H4B525_GIGMA|nr:Deoxyhypusine synthase [Gigaspora margarita]
MGDTDKDDASFSVPTVAAQAVLVKSASMPDNATTVIGPDFNQNHSLKDLLNSYSRIGFQATSVGQAINVINQMRNWRLSDDPLLPDESDNFKLPTVRSSTKCKIFLGYTSNLVSSGLREIFRFLVQHSLVDVVVTTAGGVEEDFIKCLNPTYVGDFNLPGAQLREKGINRIGNLLVPNENYCKFEDWVLPILDRLLEEQKSEGIIWSPSKIIHRLGKEIDNPDSIYYWAYKNNIPVYCPALTDGSLVKHHICNANLMRNGADYAVYINTGQEFDGSDSGARPDEAVSWGKIRMTAEPVKVYADATIVFPLIVAETFAKEIHN